MKLVKLFIALMYNNKEVLVNAVERLKELFGEVDLESDEYNFNFTDYYKEEFGDSLKKIIISFKGLIKREELAEIKNKTIEVENEFLISNKREINIDPGYLTEHNVVLASIKELPHRIYIGKNTFAESTLFYKKEEFNDYSFTFPDYQQKIIKDVFLKLRERYREQLK